MNYRRLASLCLYSCMALHADNIQEEILVVINSHVVTRKMFQKEVDFYRRGKSGDNVNIDLRLTREATLQNLINSYVFIDKANDMGITVSDTQLRPYVENIKKTHGFASDFELELAIKKELGIDLKFFLNNVRRDIIKREVIQYGISYKVPVTSKELQDYYDEHKNEYQKASRFRIRELVLPQGSTQEEKKNAEKKIGDIKEKLKHMESFESLVRIYSTAPSSSSGGDIGWITTNMLHPELEAAVLAIQEKGQVTNPIESGKDIYLVQLIDTEYGGIQSFEEVQESIRERIEATKIQRMEDAYVNNLIARADIRYVVPQDIILKE